MGKRCIPRLLNSDEKIVITPNFIKEVQKTLLLLLEEDHQLTENQLICALDALEDEKP